MFFFVHALLSDTRASFGNDRSISFLSGLENTLMADFYLDDDEAQCTIEKSNIENFAMKAFGLAKVPNNTFFFIALFAHFTVYFIYGQVEEALRAYDASSKDEALKENAIALSLSYILQFLV